MTLNVHRRRDWKRCREARVFLDGIDVTRDCFYADGRRGVVRVYVRDAAGQLVRGVDAIVTAERRGRVRWGVSSPWVPVVGHAGIDMSHAHRTRRLFDRVTVASNRAKARRVYQDARRIAEGSIPDRTATRL